MRAVMLSTPCVHLPSTFHTPGNSAEKFTAVVGFQRTFSFPESAVVVLARASLDSIRRAQFVKHKHGHTGLVVCYFRACMCGRLIVITLLFA